MTLRGFGLPRRLEVDARFYLKLVVALGVVLAIVWTIVYFQSSPSMQYWIRGVLLPVGATGFTVAVVALVIVKRIEDRYL